MTLIERDKKLLWHPFTQEKTTDLPIAIKNGKGAYLYDENEKSYLDLISSWWVNLHGHANPLIANSIYKQAQLLEHVIFAGFTHEPAVQLCECLQNILPKPLERFFFSDNGSTAVEVALKMAYQYWYNQNEKQRTLFISFSGAYHGDTFGAMAVGKKSNFHNQFLKLLFEVIILPFPETWDNDYDYSKKEEEALNQLEEQLNKNSSKIAALILEPLVQGASGMRKYRKEFIQQVVTLVRKYNILVIFDEVMTGFGRTGTYFATDQLGITPDIVCISKGITGGFLPLALTVTTQEIYNQFLSDKWSKALAHGHSYTANPLACSAAIASFNILIKKETQNSIKGINISHINGIDYLSKSLKDKIKHTRIIGTIAAFEVNSQFDINKKLKSAFFKAGLLIRPLGNTIYLLPPYCVTSSELENSYNIISDILKKEAWY